jgi:hypothetical protein
MKKLKHTYTHTIERFKSINTSTITTSTKKKKKKKQYKKHPYSAMIFMSVLILSPLELGASRPNNFISRLVSRCISISSNFITGRTVLIRVTNNSVSFVVKDTHPTLVAGSLLKIYFDLVF